MKLKECCLNITDGEHGTVIDDENGSYYLLSNKNIIDSNIVFDETDRKISKESFERINKRCKIEEGDIVISTVGTLGKTAVLNNKINYVFQRSVGIIKVDKSKLNPYFLKYQLDTPEFQKRLDRLSKGAIQKCLFIGDIADLDVTVPDIKTQDTIVSVLKKIDDKISLNNSIYADLEAMAKQLYDYWFVQFDFPDENGKPYKSSGGKMVWNEKLKREIPEGFSALPITSVTDVIDCLHSKKPEYSFEDEQCYLLSLENITKDGHIDISKKYYISKENYSIWTKKVVAQENDVVVTNAGRAGDIGRIPSGVECAIGRNITLIRPNTINPYYFWRFLKSPYLKQQVSSMLDSGSFFTSFNVYAIKQLSILIPSKSALQKYVNKCEAQIIKLEELQAENQTLTSLRDFLLPMLMNGQITVKKH